jgi:hypothetical protein
MPSKKSYGHRSTPIDNPSTQAVFLQKLEARPPALRAIDDGRLSASRVRQVLQTLFIECTFAGQQHVGVQAIAITEELCFHFAMRSNRHALLQ